MDDPASFPASPSASVGSPDSASSFASASSLFHMRWERPCAYESTVTLQQISALLGSEAGLDCCSVQEEESRSSSAQTPPGCPDLTLTLEGAEDHFSFNSLGRDSVEELVFSSDCESSCTERLRWFFHRCWEAWLLFVMFVSGVEVSGSPQGQWRRC